MSEMVFRTFLPIWSKMFEEVQDGGAGTTLGSVSHRFCDLVVITLLNTGLPREALCILPWAQNGWTVASHNFAKWIVESNIMIFKENIA